MGHLSIPLDGPPRFFENGSLVEAVTEEHLRALGGEGRMIHIDLTATEGPVEGLYFMPDSATENDKARYLLATFTNVHVLITGPAVLEGVDHKSCIQALEEYS